MGNSESQLPDGGVAASPEMRTCYYEILEVERSDTTTTDDIKKVSYPVIFLPSSFLVSYPPRMPLSLKSPTREKDPFKKFRSTRARCCSVALSDSVSRLIAGWP